MKRFKRSFLLILCLAVILMAISGCGSTGKNDASATQAQESTTKAGSTVSEKSNAEPAEITYITMKTGADLEFVKAKVNSYNEKYAGKYNMTIEEVPGADAYNEKIKVLFASDDMPVLFNLYNFSDMLQRFIDSNSLTDLKPYIDADPEWKSVLLEKSIDFCTQDGKIISAPRAYSVYAGVFYNKELFTKAGISEFPKTWDDFFKACEALKSNSIIPISLMTDSNAWCSVLVQTAMMASTEEGKAFLDVKNPTDYSNQAFVESAGKLQNLFGYTTDDAIGGTYATAANNFFNSKTAMIANGPWMISAFKDGKSAPAGFIDKVGYALYPGNVTVSDDGAQFDWSVTSKWPKEVQDGAVEFLKLESSKENLMYMVANQGVVAPKITLSQEFDSKLDAVTKEWGNTIKNTSYVAIPAFSSQWPASVVSGGAITKELPLLALKRITPEEYAKRLTEAAKASVSTTK